MKPRSQCKCRCHGAKGRKTHVFPCCFNDGPQLRKFVKLFQHKKRIGLALA